MAAAYSNLTCCIAFVPKLPTTSHFPKSLLRSRTCGFGGILVSSSRCQAKFEEFQENIKDDDLEKLMIQEPNDAEEEYDSLLAF